MSLWLKFQSLPIWIKFMEWRVGRQSKKFAKELKEKSIQFLKIRNRKNLEHAKAEAYTMTVLFANDNVFACDSKPDNVFDAVELSKHNLVEETS